MNASIIVARPDDGPLAILQVAGYLNQAQGNQAYQLCVQLLENGVQDLLMNLADCSMINSVGISYLIELLEKVEARGGRLAFCQATETIEKTLQIMGLLQRTSLYETQQEALQVLQGGDL